MMGRAARWCLALAIIVAGAALIASPAVASKLSITVMDGTEAVSGADVAVRYGDAEGGGPILRDSITTRPGDGQGKAGVQFDVPDGKYKIDVTFTDAKGVKKAGHMDVTVAGPKTSVTVFVDPAKASGVEGDARPVLIRDPQVGTEKSQPLYEEGPRPRSILEGGPKIKVEIHPGDKKAVDKAIDRSIEEEEKRKSDLQKAFDKSLNRVFDRLILNADHPKHVLLPLGVDPEKVIKDYGLLAATYFAIPDGAGGGTSLSCHADDAQWAKIENDFCKNDPSACSTNSCKEWLFPSIEDAPPVRPTLLQRIKMHGASQVKIDSKIVETTPRDANELGISKSYKGGVKDGTGKPLAGATVALMEAEPKIETALDDDPKNDPKWTPEGVTLLPVDKKGEFALPAQLVSTPYSAGDGAAGDPKTGGDDWIFNFARFGIGGAPEILAAVGWESTSVSLGGGLAIAAPNLAPPGGLFTASTPKECEWITVPRTDVPDFGGQAAGMATAADEKLPKPAPEKQACPGGQQGGWLYTPWPEAARSFAGRLNPITPARAEKHGAGAPAPKSSPSAPPAGTPESVTSAEGPLAGQQFGELSTDSPLVPEGRAIRDIQSQMTQNGGRDNTLKDESWAKLQQQAEFAEAYIRVCNRDGFLFTMEGMVASLRKLQARLDELNTLRDRVNEGLDQQVNDMKEMLEHESKQPSTWREAFAGPGGKVKAAGMTAEVLEVLTAFGIHIGGKIVPIVAIPTTIAAVSKCIKRAPEWVAFSAALEHTFPRVLDRAEKVSDLSILIAQYESRLEAQRELINQLSNAFDEHACRKCVGGEGATAGTGTQTRGPGTGTGTGTGAGAGSGSGTGAGGGGSKPKGGGVSSTDGSPPVWPKGPPGVRTSGGGRPR